MLTPLAAITPVARLAPGEAEPERRHGNDRRSPSPETSRSLVYERGPDGEFYPLGAENATSPAAPAPQVPAVPGPPAPREGFARNGALLYAAVARLETVSSPLGRRLDLYV